VRRCNVTYFFICFQDAKDCGSVEADTADAARVVARLVTGMEVFAVNRIPFKARPILHQTSDTPAYCQSPHACCLNGICPRACGPKPPVNPALQ
jgi:hypothetical protein